MNGTVDQVQNLDAGSGSTTSLTLSDFDTSGFASPSGSAFAFASYFRSGVYVAAYDGARSGVVPLPVGSGTDNLAITSSTVAVVPNGYSAIHDMSTNDKVSLGNGNTTVFLSGNTTLSAAGGTDTVYAAGNDTITAGSGDLTVDASTGSVTAYGGSGELDVIGGTGSVFATAGSGSAVLYGSTDMGSTTFYGGVSRSIMVAGSGSGTSLLVGGTGATTEFGAGSGNVTFVAGANGTSIMAGQYGTGAETFFTAQNTTAIMALNGANDTVVGGTGNAAVVAGSGQDIFGFLNGYAGGSETIYGLQAKDSLVFGGYNGDPITSEQVINGSDVITLTDQTVINLIGVDHKVF